MVRSYEVDGVAGEYLIINGTLGQHAAAAVFHRTKVVDPIPGVTRRVFFAEVRRRVSRSIEFAPQSRYVVPPWRSTAPVLINLFIVQDAMMMWPSSP